MNKRQRTDALVDKMMAQGFSFILETPASYLPVRCLKCGDPSVGGRRKKSYMTACTKCGLTTK